jgi:hypothetical protein
MGLVTGAVRDHAAKELEDLRAKRTELLEKAAEIGREISVIEAHQILGAEHAAAEGKSNGKSAPTSPQPATPGRGKITDGKE